MPTRRSPRAGHLPSEGLAVTPGSTRAGSVRAAYLATAAPLPRGSPPSSPSRASSTSATASRCCFDEGSFVEDGRYANATTPGDLPADGVVTGRGTIDGRPASSSPTTRRSRPGSWGSPDRREDRPRHRDRPARGAAGLLVRRLGRGPDHRPGRDVPRAGAGAGRIFHNQVALSGKVPQICCLFGPSAAGGAYIPSFCDLIIMVEGNASMYLGSPRMAEMVVGEKVTPRGDGRRADALHRLRACGDLLAQDDEEAIELAKLYFSYFPNLARTPADLPPGGALGAADAAYRAGAGEQPFDMPRRHRRASSTRLFFEIKPLFAPELVIGFGRMNGEHGRHRGQQLRRQGRRAVHRQRRQGHPVHLAVRRLQRSR
jgi:acetyl-CoA carboxylase carboxyltransferase component